MLPRLIALLLIVVLAVFIYKQFGRLSEAQKKRLLKVLLFSSLGVLLLVLALSGRLHWLVAAVGALIPLIPRAIRLALGIGPTVLPYFRRYQQNKQSSMQTPFIKLQIDMLSGELMGEVLQGEFVGQKLQQLSLEQLQQLLALYRQQDANSANLLVAYLNRAYPGWSGGSAGAGYTPSDTSMTEQQARDILGVPSSADKTDVIKAHKRLIQKLHPDRGGSDYLAVQVNQARDLLMSLLEGGSA